MIFVVSAVSSTRVKFLLSVKKFQKSEKITVLGSVYIAAVNVLFYWVRVGGRDMLGSVGGESARLRRGLLSTSPHLLLHNRDLAT